MERLIPQVLLVAVLVLPVSLLGAPEWAVIVALLPAMAIVGVVLPDGAARELRPRDRLPSPGRAVLLVVVVSAAAALGAAGLMDSWPGIAIWAGGLGAIVVAGRIILRRRERPGTA